ncbi:MAG: penicillin-binding transpeptidase domain-containing protein [Myxococcales bacterium]|nr:penicillin-binding transpeptidase domain-containing protein [Myxococcales bacterium]
MSVVPGRTLTGVLSAGVLALASTSLWLSDGPQRARASGSGSAVPALSTTRPRSTARRFALDPLAHRAEGELRVADLDDGSRAELTLDASLQQHLTELYRRYEVPYGAAVALEPHSGRVLAYVSHSSANPKAGDLVRDPSPPSASVFKVITASALVDAGVTPGSRVCYSGGFRRLQLRDLNDDPKRDKSCATLSEAMGGSINTVFAKLADRHLDQPTVERYAEAFGFGHHLPFDAATRVSRAEVPEERLEFARTAAGFWHMHMSPLHGALIAATIANDGAMPRASIVERVVGEDGAERYRLPQAPKSFRSVLPRGTAQAVGRMMSRTVTHGTSRSAFYDPAGRPFLPGVEVAGKTGSLSSERPYRAYSWWVGFAPRDKPQIAVAALVVNTPKWRIKASYVAREALRHYLIAGKRTGAASKAPGKSAQ